MDRSNSLLSGYKNLLTAAILFIISVSLGAFIIATANTQRDQAQLQATTLLSTVAIQCSQDENLRGTQLCRDTFSSLVEVSPECIPFIYRP